jgi:hypothetical protein
MHPTATHRYRPGCQDRRQFLGTLGGGFGSLAFASLLSAEERNGSSSQGLHHPPRARRVIQLFMNGGASPMDTFDYKPELEKRHGESIDFGLTAAVTSPVGTIMKSPFKFQQHGECGRWVSDVFPRVATQVDRMAFLMAIQSQTNVHGPASYLANTGFLMPGFPCLGAWISYGLGRLTDELPTFVVLPDARGLPYNNTGNFSAGFLPAAHASTVIRATAAEPVPFLNPPKEFEFANPDSERAGLALLEKLNRSHLEKHEHDPVLEARLESFELAAKMQVSAPQVMDLSRESQATLDQYGLNRSETADFGRNCLLARRMVEQGVRFVQVWSGMGGPSSNWDNHTDIHNELPFIAGSVDQPIAALLADLESRGLLEDTLVVWTTEFGRMPFTQGATGRDHNGGTYVSWLAGAGVQGGVAYGQSDEFAYQTASDATTGYDLNATILHLLGIDHERLTFRHNGLERRLTDVHGRVVHEILT